jgi:hypothetical protein
MKYPIAVSGCEGQQIELSISFWTGEKILVNGVKAPKGKHRLEYILTRNDGTQTTALLKRQAIGLDVPSVMVDGQEIRVVVPLKWYQWVWLAVPMAILIGSGLAGAILGVIGISVNTRVFRENANPVLNYVLTGLVTGLLYLLFFGIVVVINMLKVMATGSN